jgi:hypothetical protein
MARQSASPKRPSTAHARRRWTLEQANSTLPLVKRVVSDIISANTTIQRLHSRLEVAAPAKEQQALQIELDAAQDHLLEYEGELSGIGCELKDRSTGLVDFIGRHQGRDVYLCWKMGEDKIAYWHEMQAGFAGRQAISTLQETP